MTVADFRNARDAREHFKDILDAAADDGRPTTITRDSRRIAAVDAERFVHYLSATMPARAELVAEGDGWSIFIPGLPVAADGATAAEAVDEMVDALRNYSAAWIARLRLAPNHATNWGLVQLVTLASDDQIRAWLQA